MSELHNDANLNKCEFPMLHLTPKSEREQRRWELIDEHQNSALIRPDSIYINVSNKDSTTFLSLKSVFDELEKLNLLDLGCPDVEAVRDQLLKLSSHGVFEDKKNEFLSSGVAFAVLRRISRESVHTADFINTSARLINDGLSKLKSPTEVHLLNIDRADRPSLKAFARAMLLLKSEHKFSWVWLFSEHPFTNEKSNLYKLARYKLVRYLAKTLSPICNFSNGKSKGDTFAYSFVYQPNNTQDMAADLVMQNYERCFMGIPEEGLDGLVSDVERKRLTAIALVNIGEYLQALEYLKRGESISKDKLVKAHLAYMQGLITAKRSYMLSDSDSHYYRGLTYLQNLETSESNLEKAWLHNGLALNEALRWRTNKESPNLFKSAFNKVQHAFQLVDRNESPSATYLRYNLLANSAFLLEMKKDFIGAASVLQKSFESIEDDTEYLGAVNIGYRLGVLFMREGDISSAEKYLYKAKNWISISNPWAHSELILRALGELEFSKGNHTQALQFYEQGMEICSRELARNGFIHHSYLALRTAIVINNVKKAAQLREKIRLEEIEVPIDQRLISDPQSCGLKPLATKLPAYIAEIDLESLPSVDLNRFMPGNSDYNSIDFTSKLKANA